MSHARIEMLTSKQEFWLWLAAQPSTREWKYTDVHACVFASYAREHCDTPATAGGWELYHPRTTKIMVRYTGWMLALNKWMAAQDDMITAAALRVFLARTEA